MSGSLTTHVLDTARGCPAAGVDIWFYRVSGNSHRKLLEVTTNADGRTDGPIMPAPSFKTGTYELVFFAGDYLRRAGSVAGDTPFLDQIPIRFGMHDDTHYHVPLLLSPYGYSTYRGS